MKDLDSNNVSINTAASPEQTTYTGVLEPCSSKSDTSLDPAFLKNDLCWIWTPLQHLAPPRWSLHSPSPAVASICCWSRRLTVAFTSPQPTAYTPADNEPLVTSSCSHYSAPLEILSLAHRGLGPKPCTPLPPLRLIGPNKLANVSPYWRL